MHGTDFRRWGWLSCLAQRRVHGLRIFTNLITRLSTRPMSGALSKGGSKPFEHDEDFMQTVLSFLRARAVLLLGLVALGGTQTGCAHTVWMEPSVVVQARVGGPVYGPVYGPPPVVVAQAPVWMPPPVVMAPRVIMPAPVYRPGWRGERRGHGHGHGHEGWR